MSVKAVIGLGFGDEGKGITTDYLCSRANRPIVVRYCGGSQAGHTVRIGETKHIFSSFGSGTLRGVPTYWSKFCALDPIAVMNEYKTLQLKGINQPTLYIDPESPVITTFDRWKNTMRDCDNVKHGTCGVGFGATIQREEDFCHLQFKHLFNETVFKIKLQMIAEYYNWETEKNTDPVKEFMVKEFITACKQIINTPGIKTGTIEYYSSYHHDNDVILEGSQGLLLDQHIGFFPHVTRSNTGIKNIEKLGIDIDEIYYVTRAYQTRHGNGPMTNEDIPHNIKVNPNETNTLNIYQGKFRRTILDLDLLKYARDSEFSPSIKKTLVITCMDHVENEWKFTKKGRIHSFTDEENFIEAIRTYLDIDSVITFRSDETVQEKKHSI